MIQRELELRRNKFEKEASTRKRELREKAERERRQRLEARKRQEEYDKQIRERQILIQQQKEQEEERQFALRESNRGVFLEIQLSPYPLSEEVAASHGIRRWRDKVMLPPSISAELMRQEAFKNQTIIFELTAENGNRTHVGVLKFEAEEGTIQIPPHVMRCLWGPEGTYQGRVKVSYKRLQDGTFARLQPIKHGFHEAVGEEMKDVLEQMLSEHIVLTEGDILEIPLPNQETHHLKVVELEPASAVRILHTDLAVDILPSEEVEDVVRRRMESDSSFSMSRTNRLQKYKIAKQAASPSPEPSTPSFEEQKVETLPPEAPESEDAITCCIRFPDGTSATRRFMLDDSISNLLHFVRLKGMSASVGNGIKLITQFPRCVISQEQSKDKFRQYGFDRRQTFFVEC